MPLLFDTGWQRQPQTWNDASIWSNADGREVLIPSSDELADTDLRVAEIMSALTVVEGRYVDEIAGDINTPFDDVQLYRTFPEDDFISLAAGLLMLRGMRDLISAAARTVVDGPHPVLPGVTPRPVNDLLQLIRLGPDRSADHLFTVRIPLTSTAGLPGNGQPWTAADTTPLGRQIGHQLRAAVVAAQSAAEQATEQDLTAFDESVAAGVFATYVRSGGIRHGPPSGWASDVTCRGSWRPASGRITGRRPETGPENLARLSLWTLSSPTSPT